MAITTQRIAASRHIDDNPRAFVLEQSSDSDSDIERGTPPKQPGRSTPKSKSMTRSLVSPSKKEGFDAEAFLQKRVMTPNQERFNAITMIPGMVYSLYFILAGCWTLCDHQDDSISQLSETSDWADMKWEAFGSEHGWRGSFGCMDSTELPYLMVVPPLPVVAAAAGTLVHSPVSIIYHWFYATSIEPSYRVKHWSRRLDHAFIHFLSACAAYATSGRVDFFLLNAAFNMDCAYKHFEEKVHPRRNLYRIALSVSLSILPVLMRRAYFLLLQFIVMFAVSGWVSSSGQQILLVDSFVASNLFSSASLRCNSCLFNTQ